MFKWTTNLIKDRHGLRRFDVNLSLRIQNKGRNNVCEITSVYNVRDTITNYIMRLWTPFTDTYTETSKVSSSPQTSTDGFIILISYHGLLVQGTSTR